MELLRGAATDDGAHNTPADPKFVNAPAGDWHLAPGSPCRDRGNWHYLLAAVLADIDGETRLAGMQVDMGADEIQSAPDRDADLLADADEAAAGALPDLPDTDGDGLLGGLEIRRGTAPGIADEPTSGQIVPAGASIQRAVLLSIPGETVSVQPGRYDENLYLGWQPLTLQGSDPTSDSVVAATIVDGRDLAPTLVLGPPAGDTTIIRGLTLCAAAGAFKAAACWEISPWRAWRTITSRKTRPATAAASAVTPDRSSTTPCGAIRPKSRAGR
ncbi:MAG: hypothetical protein Kow0059_05610 [Candidatus Sumerlaeia bacterium]